MQRLITLGLLAIVLLTAGAIMLVHRWTEYEGSGRGLSPSAVRAFDGPATSAADQGAGAPRTLTATPLAASPPQPEPPAASTQPQIAPPQVAPPADPAPQEEEPEPAPAERRSRRRGRMPTGE